MVLHRNQRWNVPLSQRCIGLAVCGLSSPARLTEDGSHCGCRVQGWGGQREREKETQRCSFFCMGYADQRLSTVLETGRTLGLFVQMECGMSLDSGTYGWNNFFMMWCEPVSQNIVDALCISLLFFSQLIEPLTSLKTLKTILNKTFQPYCRRTN